MRISKVLMIDSPVHLWRLLKSKEDLISDSYIQIFMDSVDSYINGCKCNEDENYNIMISYYNDIKDESNILLSIFGCDRVELK